MCLPAMTPGNPQKEGVRGSEGVLSSAGCALLVGWLWAAWSRELAR